MFLLLVLPLTAVLVPSASPEAFCEAENGKLDESYINTNILNIINNRRKKLANGNLKDGTTTAKSFPKAKEMNKLAWDCEMEQKALAEIGTCPTPTDPTTTLDTTKYTGFYYKDDKEEEPLISVVVNEWLREGTAQAWPTDLDTLTNPDDIVKMYDPAVISGLDNFANLMRFDLQKIGCAELNCPDAGTGKTFVYCLSSIPALKKDETVYVVGTPCTDDTQCTTSPNTQCDKDTGLCEEPVVSTTAASTTAESTTAASTAGSTAATTEVTTAAETTTEASYPGELPTGTNSMCQDHDGMTDELRMHFLDTQNYRRSILAKGQVPRPSGNLLPQGANIIKLTLNCPLEWEAIKEVRQCPTMKTQSTGYGKNFDTFASSTATSTYRDAIKKAVTNWWKVSRTETDGPGVNAVTFRDWHVNKPVATYTQIAWANTKDIGCAIAKCSSSYTVICLYDPAGNIPEEPMYKIGAPCTACPSGTTPDSALGLCVQN